MNSKILSSICSKHGEVLNMTFSISGKENGILKERHYCIYCLADIFDELQKIHRTPKLTVKKEVEKKNMKDPNMD